MKVLIACEYSARIRDAFRRAGHDAWSCDLLDCEGDPRWHIKADMRSVIQGSWDFVGYHTPCTRLCNSGVRWLSERNLWGELDQACEFFNISLDDTRPGYSENPIPHKYAIARIRRKYDQIIQPWQFGHPETKATCIWLRDVAPLMPTHVVDGRNQRLFRLPPSADRWKERSRTYQGIADAMAAQWGLVEPLRAAA